MAEIDLNSYPLGPRNDCIVGLIGSGNMAYAIASGLIKKGLSGDRVIVSARQESSFHSGWKNLKVQETVSNISVIESSLITIICCKPGNLEELSKGLLSTYSSSKIENSGKTIISVLAGVSLSKLKSALSFLKSVEIVRSMPNTPLQVGEGITAITPCHANKEVIEAIFKSLGMVEFLDESKFDAVTGLSGSGPAYIYSVIDGLTDAGIREGLPCELSRKFAAQTVLGAAKTVLETGKHPAQLKNEVTSPGGTTIAAVYELEKGGLRTTLMNAVKAAADRSREMNK